MAGTKFIRTGTRRTRLDGRLHPDFQPVAALLESIIDRQAGGAAFAVYHHGECVVDLWGGDLDRHQTPWREDTMAPSFSTTKGVASTLVHILADRGLVDYEARVADYWPEFAQHGKEEITLRQVLTHQSGLYHIRQMVDDASRMRDWGYMIEAIERAEPCHEPGRRTGYHGLTYGYLIGEILQRVTGKSFPDLVQREIAQPLELDGLFIGAPESELHRAAQLIWSRPSRLLQAYGPGSELPHWVENAGDATSEWLTRGFRAMGVDLDLKSILEALAPRGIAGFEFDSPETLRAAIPAANGLFTARSLARMYGALALGGEIDGVRLLSRATLDRATKRQERTKSMKVLPIDMAWRLGWHAAPTSRGVPERAFGHFGFGGSGAWADPERGLAVAFVVNCGSGTPFGDLRIVRLGGAALAAAAERDGVPLGGMSWPVGDNLARARAAFDRVAVSNWR